MAETDQPLRLNLGCGFRKILGFINVDAFDNCDPDVKWDLQSFPYPWPDNSAESIECSHTMEHLPDWWGAFKECARILRPGGRLRVRVPDCSSDDVFGYRDHLHWINSLSFHGTVGNNPGPNAWAVEQENTVPLRMIHYARIARPKYKWMADWAPWLFRFCAEHMRNFVHEQIFIFEKIG